MSPFAWKRLNSTEDHELHPSRPDYSTDEVAHSRHPSTETIAADYRNTHERSLFDTLSPSPKQPLSSRPSFNKPAAKKAFHTLHLLAAATSLICLILAIVAVAVEDLSWKLGTQNYQLIVLGFLLGIMNLCLDSVTPMFFLLLEARFGPSTLQNYNGILRNEVFSSKLSWFWRIMLSLVLALPLGLSVAYKTFTGGESTNWVHVAPYVGNTSYLGMFAPPGMQGLGLNTGVSLFSNATLPFAVAASDHNGIEPPMPPRSQQPYGYNILSMGGGSAAALDIPQPSEVSAVQALLAGGESWNFTSVVVGTVAVYNKSWSRDSETDKSDFEEVCKAAREANYSAGAYARLSMLNDWPLMLLNDPSAGDQTAQYIGFVPDSGEKSAKSCSNDFPYIKRYDISRNTCQGTWSITREGIGLVHGFCNPGLKEPPERQEVILHNRLSLSLWYMPSLVEFLGPFATSRNKSEWEERYFGVSMAAMIWSRITATHDPANQTRLFEAPKELADLGFEEAGLIYPADRTVGQRADYVRPTLRKSNLLYFVLAIQPLLIFLILGLSASIFHSTPLDKGFGLISILSGIDRESLNTLAGAALSGELARSVKLVMRPVKGDQNDAIEYHVVLPSSELARSRTEKLGRNVVYH
ncbi:MAG: hypothetical protein Q9169_001614 [Polycauliona sp. 2 TL-2023]